MSQTLTFPTWYLSGSGWSIRYSGSVTISVSRSYGSDTATVTASGWMNTPNTDGDSNASWKFWIKIGSATYTKTFTSGYHAPGTTKNFSYSWDISVGANSGTLSGQAALQAYDNNNSFGAWSDTKNWSQDYGSKGASTIASASNVNLNTSGTATSTVAFTSYSSSFTHKIKATLGSVSTDEVTVEGDNNVSKIRALTFGTDFINAINTAKSGTATVYLYTYSGSTLIGTSTKNITLTVPSGINPVVDILSIAKAAVTTNPFTKICTALDAARVTWDFGASYGSALNSGTVTVDGTTGSNTDGYYTSVTLRNSGMRTASVSATDKRGNTGSDSETFPVYEYFYPSVTVKYKRSGSAHKLTLEGKFASVGGENNTRILKLDVYKNGSKINRADISLTSFISAVTGSDTPYNDYYAISGEYTIPITDIDGHGTDISDITTETYTFKVIAQDRIAASTAEDSSGISVMTFTKGGTGIIMHKPVEFEQGVNSDLNVTGNILATNNITATNYVYGKRAYVGQSSYYLGWYVNGSGNIVTDGNWGTSSYTAKITLPVAGVYILFGSFNLADESTTYRNAYRQLKFQIESGGGTAQWIGNNMGLYEMNSTYNAMFIQQQISCGLKITQSAVIRPYVHTGTAMTYNVQLAAILVGSI